MTSHCVSIGPYSRRGAEQCADEIESLPLRPEALSLSATDAAGEDWQVDAHYATAEDAMEAAMLAVALGHSAEMIEIVSLGGTDWVRRSLEGLSPVRAGRFFVHGSHDRALRPANAVTIEIEAGTAFGTGHHATTRGCLKALDELMRLRRPRHILDIGCGSGILAIAAAKATRGCVAASDIDPEAVRLTRANARLNGACVTAVAADGARHPVIKAGAPYDLIMANILARPLCALAPSIAALAASSGCLILSGLLSEQRPWLEQVYRAWNFLPAARHEIEGWTTLTLRAHSLTSADGRDGARP